MRRTREERLYLYALYMFKSKLKIKSTIRALHNRGLTADDAISMFNELIVRAISKYNGNLSKWWTFVNRIIRNSFSRLTGKYSTAHRHNHISLYVPVMEDNEEVVELYETLSDGRVSDLDRIYDKEELEWAISMMEPEVRDYFLHGKIKDPHTYRKIARFREDIKRDYEKRYMGVY
jgi:hypothetical protein